MKTDAVGYCRGAIVILLQEKKYLIPKHSKKVKKHNRTEEKMTLTYKAMC